MRFFIPKIVLLSALLSISACVHRPPAPLFGPEGPIQDAAQVLERVKENEQSIHTLKGEGRLTLDSPQMRGSLTLLVAVAEGGKLHLELLDFFGRPLSILASDGTRFGLFQVQEGRYYQGPANAQNFSRFLPLSVPPQQLADLLRGVVPRLSSPPLSSNEGLENVSSMRVNTQDGTYRLELQQNDEKQSVWVDTLALRVRRSAREGHLLEYQDFGPDEERHLPHQLTLSEAAHKTVVTLRYSGKVSVNEPVEPALFTPKPPAHIPVLQLSEDGQLLSSDSSTQ